MRRKETLDEARYRIRTYHAARDRERECVEKFTAAVAAAIRNGWTLEDILRVAPAESDV